MNKYPNKHTRFAYAIGVMVTAVCGAYLSSPAHAQSAGDVEITEIAYNPRSGGEYIEIINTGGDIDLTTLKIGVGDGEKLAITAHSGTANTLTTGTVAIIAKDASVFISGHAGHAGLIYTAAFDLPDTNGTVALFDATGTTEINSVVYTAIQTGKTDVSLHVGLDGELVVAPATPGRVEVNPIKSYTAVEPTIAVASSVGQKNKQEINDAVFLNTDAVITLHVFRTRDLPSGTAVKLHIGNSQREMVAGNGGTDTSKSFTYTVTADDPSGNITYTVRNGDEELKNGTLIDQGKRVYIDRVAPVIAFAITSPTDNTSRKQITVGITESAPPENISYKMHDAACGTEEVYTAATETEQTVKVTAADGGKHTATIVLFGTENNDKYVCVKVTDLLEQTAYASFGQITGITDLTVEISEIKYSGSGESEWVEIVNSGTVPVTVSGLVIDDGGLKSIAYDSGGAGETALEHGDVAVITDSAEKFRIENPSFAGQLFVASLSLTNTGDTVVLKSNGIAVDTVTYTKSDGAHNNGYTLHILGTGSIFEGNPTPGIAAVASERTHEPQKQEIAVQTTTIDRNRPVVSVIHFDESRAIAPGQNIFFTKKNSVSFRVKISDDDTRYNSSNYDEKVDIEVTSGGTNHINYLQGSTTGTSSGNLHVTYTVNFAGSNTDNVGEQDDKRVKFKFTVSDNSGTKSSARNVITIVRETDAPTLTSGTSATVLGFAADDADSAIVPVTAGGIQPADWLRIAYDGPCGNGSLGFMTQNSGYGIPYELIAGREYVGCTVTVSDSAGNQSQPLSLPKLILGRQ